MQNQILSTLLQVLIETIITVVLPVVLVRLVIWINTQIVATKSKISKEELLLIETLIKQFVRAAEQSGLTGQLKAAGAEKKAFVLALLHAELEERGIKLNLEVIDAMVEAAVNDAFGRVVFDLSPSEAAG
jgi:LL-H family phage holin